MMSFILSFIQCIFLGISVIIFLNKVNNNTLSINHTKKAILLIVLLIAAISHMYFHMLIKLLYLLLMYMIINYKILNFNFKESVFNSLFIIVYFFIGDLLVSRQMNYLYENSTLLSLQLFTLANSLLASLILIGISRFKVASKIFNKFKKFILVEYNLKLLYLVIILQVLIYLVLSIMIFNYSININSQSTLIILYILCTIIIVALQLAFYKMVENMKHKQKLMTLNKFYTDKIKEDQIYRHNINNELLALKSLGKENISDLIDKMINKENERLNLIIQLSKVPECFMTVFYDKLNDKKHINLEVISNMTCEKEQCVKLVSRLGTAIAICLDNVIEESTKTKKLNLVVIFKESKEHSEVVIKNNFSNDIDIDKLTEYNYSTKNKNSGIGLHSLKKNNKIKTAIEIINDTFSITLSTKK